MSTNDLLGIRPGRKGYSPEPEQPEARIGERYDGDKIRTNFIGLFAMCATPAESKEWLREMLVVWLGSDRRRGCTRQFLQRRAEMVDYICKMIDAASKND